MELRPVRALRVEPGREFERQSGISLANCSTGGEAGSWASVSTGVYVVEKRKGEEAHATEVRNRDCSDCPGRGFDRLSGAPAGGSRRGARVGDGGRGSERWPLRSGRSGEGACRYAGH